MSEHTESERETEREVGVTKPDGTEVDVETERETERERTERERREREDQERSTTEGGSKQERQIQKEQPGQ